MNPQEFAQKIKSKYPQYQGVDDFELTNKILEKYPQYRSQVDTSQIPSAVPEEREGFFKSELTGGADTSELTGLKKFGAELFQSTLGSKGLLGVAQLPGKAIGAKSAIEEQTRLEERRGQIFDQARTLVKEMREETDPDRLERLRGLAQGLDSSLGEIESAQEGLERFTPTAKEALGTTASAAATVAPVGKFLGVPGGVKAITSLREALRGATFAAGGALSEDRLPTGGELATGAAIGAAVPVVGGAVTAVAQKTLGIAGQIGKSLTGALGVSYDDIARNPQVAQKTVETLLKGKETVQSILRRNSQQLLSDVRGFRQRLRGDFGKALESLSETQISASNVRNAAIEALEANGIKVTKTGFSTEAAEFTSQAMKKRASGIINEINTLKSLDGKSLRNIINKIEALKFKSPGADPERLAFNALMKDLSTSLSQAVSKSTPELQVANKAFSEGMQIVEVIEQEFGKVKFANLKELNTFAKKMEGLLKKKGIAPEIIDDFFARIGKDPSVLRAEEAVRSAFGKEIEAEAAGINPITLIRSLTAGIISPKDVARIATTVARMTDVAENTIRPIIEVLAKTKPVQRAAIINSLVQLFQKD